MEITVKEDKGQVFGVFEDTELMIRLRKEFRILPRAVGTLPHSLQNKILGPPFLLNAYQVQYLKELGLVQSEVEVNTEKYQVFKHFTERKFILKDGAKFGCDFLAYPGDPLYCHASKMIIVQKELHVLKLVQLGRISNDTNKELVLSFTRNGEVVVKQLTWVNTGARYCLCRERKVQRVG